MMPLTQELLQEESLFEAEFHELHDLLNGTEILLDRLLLELQHIEFWEEMERFNEFMYSEYMELDKFGIYRKVSSKER